MSAIDRSDKRIFIYGMNYAPEMAGVGRYTGEIAEYLAGAGAKVSVLTTPAHYPGWRVQKPYRNWRYQREIRKRVEVRRCPLILSNKMTGIWRLLAPLSFAFSSTPLAVLHLLARRPDVVLVVEPTLFSAPAALLVARLLGTRTVLHVQDLEVDAAFAFNHIAGHRWLKRVGGLMERMILSRFDQIITISGRMAQKLAEKNVPDKRIAVVPNWVDLDHIAPLDRPSRYRAELGYRADDFIVLYSGNIGVKQGLNVLLDAANLVKDDLRLHFVIAGEGPAKADLAARYAALGNVRFLPFQPYERLSEFLGMADLHVLPQQAEAADLVLPSKLGGMLASGRRIVAMAAPGTELADFLADAAILIPPGDAAALAKAILAATGTAADDGGTARRRRLAESLSRDDGLRNFAAALLGDRAKPERLRVADDTIADKAEPIGAG